MIIYIIDLYVVFRKVIDMINKHILVLRLSSVIQAIGYGLVTYFVIYRLIAKGDLFWTYLLNIIFIVIGLSIDRIARRFATNKAPQIREMYSEMGIFLKAVYILSQGFIRTAMYLFYAAVMIFSGVATFRPNLIPFGLVDFFLSIEYGLILLLVFDNLRGLFISDRQWLKDNLGL